MCRAHRRVAPHSGLLRKGVWPLYDHFRELCNELAKGYLVPDIVPPTATFVFLLESPHIEELKHGAPVSGASGASMSAVLFGERYARIPLGVMVKRNRDARLDRPSLDRVGLMNVSNLPLQRGAYGDHQDDGRYAPLFERMSALRQANDRVTFQDPHLNVLQEILVDHLRRRLDRLSARPLSFAPCGRFAQKFFRLAGVHSEYWRILENVPHPSYNNWRKPTYAAAVQDLCDAFHGEASAREGS